MLWTHVSALLVSLVLTRVLVDQTRKGETALHLAAEKNKSVVIDVLLSAGVDVMIANNKSETAFDVAKGAKAKDAVNSLAPHMPSQCCTIL